MPIVASIVAQVTSEENNQERVREEHTDHTGKVHHFRYKAVKGADHSQKLAEHAAQLIANLEEDEGDVFSYLLGLGETTQAFQHITKQKAARKVLLALMKSEAKQAVRCARWLNDNFTNVQLRDMIPVEYRTLVSDRITALMNIEAELLADNAERIKL